METSYFLTSDSQCRGGLSVCSTLDYIEKHRLITSNSSNNKQLVIVEYGRTFHECMEIFSARAPIFHND